MVSAKHAVQIGESEPGLRYRVSENLARIDVQPPRNGAGHESAVEYFFALLDADRDSDVAAIVVTATWDRIVTLSDIPASLFREETDPSSGRCGDAYDVDLWVGKPVIACADGHMASDGLALFLATDVRFVTEATTFECAIPPDHVRTLAMLRRVLPPILGRSRTLELLLSGRTISAREALDLGMVHHVVSSDSLVDETTKYARRVAQQPRWLVAQLKAQMYRTAPAE